MGLLSQICYSTPGWDIFIYACGRIYIYMRGHTLYPKRAYTHKKRHIYISIHEEGGGDIHTYGLVEEHFQSSKHFLVVLQDLLITWCSIFIIIIILFKQYVCNKGISPFPQIAVVSSRSFRTLYQKQQFCIYLVLPLLLTHLLK